MPPFDTVDVPEALARWVPAGTTLAFPAQGMTSNVAFTEPGDVVLKRCVDRRYLDWLRREREVLEALAGTSLPVPRVLDHVDHGGEVWLVMTRVPGVRCADVLVASDPAARPELLRVVGAAVRRLHETPVPESLRFDGEWIDRMLAAARANLDWCDGSAELLERLRRTRPQAVAPALIHGDLDLENVLVADGAVSGFVDWAGGGAGDPRYDVALAVLGGEEMEIDDGMPAGFFSGYGAVIGAVERAWFEGLYEFF